MLVSLALTHRQSQLQLALIDLKGRGFAPLAGQAQPTGKVPRIGILYFGAAPVGALSRSLLNRGR